MKLTEFKALSFDCYGTLIDWETGLYTALQPLLKKGGVTLTREEVLCAYARQELAQETATPQMIYSELLAEVYRRLAREWNVGDDEEGATAFGRSVPQWPAFPDTPAALQYLQRHYKLVILSNVDRASFAGTNRRLGVTFDAICTAQDIGSYKPDPRNFSYLIDTLSRLGVSKSGVLHTAQSLYHDHVPAQAAGLRSAWIDRGHGTDDGGATVRPAHTPKFDFRFGSLGEMAQAHQAQTSQA
jgi:2-haloacid dehalogenase